MSASTDLKLSESVRAHLEDFLDAECFVGDIYTSKYNTEKKQVHKHKNIAQT